MNLIILKENIKKALNSIERSISENSNLPILKNVLVKTDNNKIILSATNLEIGTTHIVSGKIIENGRVTVPMQVLNSLVNNLTAERINLEKKDYNLIIKTDNYEAVIQGVNPEDFPIIPTIKDINNKITVKSEVFNNALNKVINAAQFSDIHPEISGVLMNYEEKNIKLVATDSFRLSEKSIPNSQFKSDIKESFKIILPLKTAKEILKIFTNEEMDIIFDGNQVLFRNPEVELVSRVIDGQYPNYEGIIPKEFLTDIIIQKNELINALKLAGVFTGKVNDVKLNIPENNKYLEIYSSDSGLGENKYLVEAKIKGSPIKIGFNLRYLIDGLKSFDGEEIIIGLNNETKPSILKPVKDNSFFYILMPIRG